MLDVLRFVAVLNFGINDTDAVFEAVAESGLRATIGKCMMDFNAETPRLQEDTQASIDESLAIRKRWNGAANDRLRAAFAPLVPQTTEERGLTTQVR